MIKLIVKHKKNKDGKENEKDQQTNNNRIVYFDFDIMWMWL